MASNFCRNCGFRLTEGKSFCGNCGTMVIRRDPAAAAPAQPAPAPVQAAPAAAAPVIAAAPSPAPAEAVPAEPVITPEPEAAPAPAVTVAPEAEIISPMPQPMQTVVTYHPDEVTKVELPEQALRPVAEAVPAEEPVEVIEAFPIVPAAQEQSVPSALAVAAPVVPAVPEAAPVAPAMPAAPVAPAAPVPAAAPKKKSHVGLIIGLVCGGIVLVGLLCFGMIMMFAEDLIGNNGSGTVLDRIETMEEASSGKNYTIYNKSFDRKIESVKWWDYDGTMKSQGVYYMNTKTLAFSIQVEENTSEKLYYAFYYSKDDNFTKNDLKEAEYSDYISPSYYKDGNTYYNIECEKSLKPGHYCVIVSKDKNFKKPYAVAYAKILDQNSEVG